MTSTSKSSENFFRVWGPGALQLQEPPHGVRQGPLAQAPVVPRADVHGAPALLSGADHCRKGGAAWESQGKFVHMGYLPLLCGNRRGLTRWEGRGQGPDAAQGRISFFSRLLPPGSQLILSR